MKTPVQSSSQNSLSTTSLLAGFRSFINSLDLSSISRKLYLADINRFLSSNPELTYSISLLTNPKTYLEYLKQPELTSSTTLTRRTLSSLRQFGAFLSATYSVENPTTSLSLTPGTSLSPLNDTASKYIKAFTKYLNSIHLGIQSIKSYKSDVTQYLVYLSSHHPSTHISLLLNEKNLQKYTDELTHSLIQSPATIDRKTKTIRRFINWVEASKPQIVSTDNTKIAAITPNYDSLSPSDQSDSTFTVSPLNSIASSESPSIEVGDVIVKNKNYRKSRIPTLRSLVTLGILLLFVSTLSILAYRQFGSEARLTAAFPSTPVTPNRQLSFQGRLENSSGTPITAATNFVFKLFDASSGGTELYSSGTCSITPDADGVFSTQIGSTCGAGIGSGVFTENADVWLEVTVAAETLDPRQQIATVAYALNSETLQGFPISATVSAIKNTVVPMNQWGEIIVGEQSPRLTGVAGTFQISAPSLSLVTATGTNGNITLAPDGTGQINFQGNTTTTNFFNVSNAQLTTGSLITGTAANNNTGFKLIDLISGSSPTSKFSVDYAGNTTLATGADLFIGTIGLNDIGSSNTTSGASLIGTYDEFDNSASATVQDVLDDLDAAITTGIAGAGDITAVGSMTSGATFADSSADDDWLGLGASAGRIEFDDQATDEINFLDANVGIGTTAPGQKLEVVGYIRSGNGTNYVDVGYDGANNRIQSNSNLLINYNAGSVQTSIGSGSSTGFVNLKDSLYVINGGNVGIGDTTPASMFTVGSGDLFQVNSSGDMVKIKNVTYSWPSSQGAANTVLTNNGSGTLSWGTIGAASIADDSLDFDKFQDTLDLDANLILNQGSYTWVQNFTGTTTDGLTYNANSLTSGDALNISSTSTALTTGSLLGIDWSPGSSTTATGDLFSLNIGANGNIGNLFNIKDSNSSLFSVSETALTSNLPTNFTSPGDVSIAYDLVFTNPTASYIKSSAPLYLQAGETFNSSDLNLQTYNKGNVIANSEAFVTTAAATISGQLVAGTSTAPANIGGSYFTNSSTFGKSLMSLNQTESQDILTASASGTTRFTIKNDGDLYLTSGLSTYSTAVSNGTIEAAKFCTGDGETNCVTDFSALSGSAGIWTDGGTYAYLTNGEVLGNSASAGANKLAGIYLGDSSPLYFGTDNDINFSFSGSTLAVTQGNNDINFDSNTLFIDGSANSIGIGDNTPDHTLDVNGNIGLTAGGYINWGDTTGTTGYGFRDNAGTIEFKNSAGAWAAIGSGGGGWTDAGTYLYPTSGEVLGNSAAAGANKLAGIYLADSSPLTFGTDNDFSFSFNNTTSTLGSTLTSGTRLGINTTSALATLDIRSNLGTIPVASIAGSTSQAALVVDNTVGDLFTASSSGLTRFVITQNGNVGIGTTGPDAPLDVLSTGGTQLRLTYADGSTYTNLNTNSSGDLTIDATGGDINLSDNLNFAGGTTYYINSSGDAVFRDLQVLDSANPGLTVGSGTTGYVKIGSSTIYDGNNIYLSFDPDSDSSDEMRLTNDGQLQLLTTGSSGGIQIGGDVDLYRSAANELTINDSATVSANLTVGGQFQLGRFESTPTAIGAGTMIFDTTNNNFKCYNGTNWFNCGGTLFSNTNASVTDGSYITVAHNLATNDLLSSAWINAQGVWKQLDATYQPAIAWEGKDTQKGIYHNAVNSYILVGNEASTPTNTLHAGMVFDTFEDTTKTDSGNTTASLSTSLGDDGSSNFTTLDQRVQSGRVGLMGGQTLNTSETDNDGQTYLGSNTVNDIYYYDRAKDSVPEVLVELGIDPNWYNGVTLSVATSSATYSQAGTLVDKNPNLTTSYNGSLIKVTGTDSQPRTIYITIKSPTTFDWTNYQGDAATGVTITPGTAQSLGATGVSVTFTGGVSYNVGDVFKIASWYIEAESATRGAKQQFPERANIVATASSVDIIDADTQKLWMRFSQTTSYFLKDDANNDPSSVQMLNSTLYISLNGASAQGVVGVSFANDNATNYTTSGNGIKGPVSLRNTALTYVVQNSALALVNVTANDVSAAVIPNQPTKEITVSGWGYIAGDTTTSIGEFVNFPYKFNSVPNVMANYAGMATTTAPTSLESCTGVDFISAGVEEPTNSTVLIRILSSDGGTMPTTNYYCYTWTATGTVSPKQFVAAGTGTTGTDGGTTIINETDGTKADVMIGSQHGNTIWQSKVWLTSKGTLYTTYNDDAGTSGVFTYYNVPSLTSEPTWVAYENGYYIVGGSPGSWKLFINSAGGVNKVTSLNVTEGTSTVDGSSNTIYVGTDRGVTVIQEKQSHVGDYPLKGAEEALGSVKYYTKDYISEEMIGDIRGMWPLNASNTASDLEDISVKANNLTATNITSADAVSGVRGEATDFDGSTEYLSRADDSDFDFTATESFSIGAWVKTSVTSTQTIVSKYDGGNAYWSLYTSSANGFPQLQIRDSSANLVSATSSLGISDNKWHHIVGVRDVTNDKVHIYVDGQLTASANDTTTATFANTGTLSIARQTVGTPYWFTGSIDELFVTATALTPAQIRNMYQVGYRALQSHGTGLSSGTADGNQALAGASNNVGVVAPDYNNQYMYVGTNHTTDGALTKIQLNSDTAIKNWDVGDNDPDGGAQIIDDDITSLAVGETLYAVGSAASGVKTMGLDDNATATSGNFVSKTYTLPKNIGSAVLWVSPVTDSNDGSNTITVKASNDGGSNYATCTLVGTDNNYTVAEREYACTFPTADNELKVKFEFARGSTKTNTYVVQYGISWLGETGFRVEQADNNNVRLYNFSGETQNLKLSVTGASTAALANPWTDAGSYLYPTGYEEIRIYNGAGSNYLTLSDTYINFGSSNGSSGYGIRDNAGVMEFKNSAGSWVALGTGGGDSWWDQTSGTLQPHNKTVDLLLGGTATSSAKIALLNINSGTPTASISAGTSGALYLNANGAIATTAKQTLALGDSSTTGNIILQGGNVGIGVASPTQKLEVNGYIVGQRFEDSASSAYYLDPASTGTSLSIDGNIVGNGAFYISTGNDAVAVSIGTTGAGKLDAGTIDPPYTINGEKFATYMSSMTGVKEETTGSVDATEYVIGKGYRATLDFANALKGSDLWLFAQTSNLQSQLDRLVVLTTAAGMGKTWYEMDASAGKLYLYAQSPTRISYRLTAPRFDAATWTNTRDSESLGFVIDPPTTWSVSSEIASLYNQISDTISHTLTNLLSVNTISPLAEGESIQITSPVLITPTTPNPDLPTLVVEGEIQATTISARLAQLESIQADSITAKNIVADTISANYIEGLDAKIASLSAMSDNDIQSITDRIKDRLSELTNPVAATDLPSPATDPDYTLPLASTPLIASSAATLATADINFATINEYLAVIGTASITTLNVNAGLFTDTINSQTGTLALQSAGGILDLAAGTLLVDSAGSVAINGDLYVNGRILADSASLNSLSLGNTPTATTSSALGNLLAIYNEEGQTVATIDASGSANLAKLTTNMITIASSGTATDSSALSTLTGNSQSNATAGTATLTSPNTELTINSPYVTPNSLVYLTPTTNTDNKVLFVKAKSSCETPTTTCIPSFTVGIDAAAGSDLSFNWWIIELKNSTD